MPEFGTGVRLRATDPRYLEILDFLWDEAAILDRDDLAGWRDMLDVNLSYRMPVCLTRKRASQESYETAAMNYDEDYPSICFRIRRFVETQAWAADPQTGVRRFVPSVRAREEIGRAHV